MTTRYFLKKCPSTKLVYPQMSLPGFIIPIQRPTKIRYVLDFPKCSNTVQLSDDWNNSTKLPSAGIYKEGAAYEELEYDELQAYEDELADRCSGRRFMPYRSRL